MQRLKSKVVLVTGGASGLGKVIAERLKSEGATVVITDVQESVGQQTASECGFTFLQQDVADESQWGPIIRAVQDQYRGLHVLVNNAGILGPQDAVTPMDTRIADWRKIFAVNVEGVLLGCRAAIPAIHESGGGSIVNMSSIAGLSATPYQVAYGAAKAAVRHLTRSIAQYCLHEKLKIRCNSVHPGNVRTALWDKVAEQGAHKRGVSFDRVVQEIKSVNPMGDFTMPEDVAASVAFLASEDARRMTGAELLVDAGSYYCNTYQMRERLHEMSLR